MTAHPSVTQVNSFVPPKLKAPKWDAHRKCMAQGVLIPGCKLLDIFFCLLPSTVSPWTARVARPAVHALLHVRLAGTSFVWELLLLSVELG